MNSESDESKGVTSKYRRRRISAVEASLKAAMEENDELRRRLRGFLETSVEDLSGKEEQSIVGMTEEWRLVEADC